MKFLVPNYSCLQNPTRRLPPPDPRSLCPQLNLLNPPRRKFLGTPLVFGMFEYVGVKVKT